MKVVGIDPGATAVGYAVVSMERGAARLLRAETISIPNESTPAERLLGLERAIAERLEQDRPDAISLERLFFGKNRKTALMVAEARGVILLTAYRYVHSIWEYAPLQVKLAITGHGGADKSAIRRMIGILLPGATLPDSDDGVDAVAIALTALYRERPFGKASSEPHTLKGRTMFR